MHLSFIAGLHFNLPFFEGFLHLIHFLLQIFHLERILFKTSSLFVLHFLGLQFKVVYGRFILLDELCLSLLSQQLTVCFLSIFALGCPQKRILKLSLCTSPRLNFLREPLNCLIELLQSIFRRGELSIFIGIFSLHSLNGNLQFAYSINFPA